MKPANDLILVKKLAGDERSCTMYSPVLVELRKHGLDTDELRAIIETELGEKHCFDSKTTVRYHPSTHSDYYSIWVEECKCRMFLKLLVATQGSIRMLVVTSFKKDTNYDV